MSFLLIFAKRFVAGETTDGAVEATKALNAQKVRATLDILGENVESEAQAASLADDYIRLLDVIKEHGLDANVSLKLTMMGLDVGDRFCRDNVERIVQKAAEYDNFVRVDMEGSAYTQRTLDLFYDMYKAHPNNVGIVIQSYLYRSEKDIEDAIAAGARVRLCKGAYKEPKEVAFPEKEDVNASYVKLMKRLLSAGNYPGIATHDEAIIEQAFAFAKENNIAPDRYEFQMLFGIRRDLQAKIAQDGFNMRTYVPFGKAWFPYFYRRMRERKENVLFVMKNYFKG
ncbi:MAG: proline dehydrogenase family protein [Deltaproteobacteria bacterium]|nr:proline dehydrogenase family protein [Deltaproteobacteria bacterium]